MGNAASAITIHEWKSGEGFAFHIAAQSYLAGARFLAIEQTTIESRKFLCERTSAITDVVDWCRQPIDLGSCNHTSNFNEFLASRSASSP
jgi:hypothetical protein